MSVRAVVLEASDADLDALRQALPEDAARFGTVRPLIHRGGGLNAPLGGLSPGEVVQTVTLVLGAAKSLLDLAKAVLDVIEKRGAGKATLRDSTEPSRVLVIITPTSTESELRHALAGR